MVLSGTGTTAPRAEETALAEDRPRPVSKPAPKASVEDSADDSLSYFAKLANDD